MLFLTDGDAQTLLPVPDAIPVMQKGFRGVEYGNVRMTSRQLTKISEHERLMLSMSAYIGGEIDVSGQKAVTIYTTT